MTWENFYLVCFLVGFALSALSFVLGSFDLHFHLPHGEAPHIHFGDAHALAHSGAPVHAAGHAGAHAADGGGEPEISWFNFGTITAFVAWFGGAGYLLSAYSAVGFAFTLALALLVGAIGGSIMFWFVAKFLMKHDKALDSRDFEMVGVVGKITSSIRAGGTGEIVYSQQGVRRCAGARSDDGKPLARDIEVVVTRYERGIAYVRSWEEFAAENNLATGTEPQTPATPESH